MRLLKTVCAEYTKAGKNIAKMSCIFAVDKCAPTRYNTSMLEREVHIMTAFATAKSGYCACAAAASTSARNMENLDTARVAVSVLLPPIISVSHT